MVGPMSSKYTSFVSGGAIFGTVASSSVARVRAMRLPAMSAALAMVVDFGPQMTIDSAPCGEQKAPTLARSVVIESDETAMSTRPASRAGDALGGVDLYELELGAEVLGELAGGGDFAAVGLAVAVEDAEGGERRLRR